MRNGSTRALRRLLAAASGGLLTASAVAIPLHDPRVDRQDFLESLLTTDRLTDIQEDRARCAGGIMAKQIPIYRGLGRVNLPDVGDYCVTVLIRLGREGILNPISDKTGKVTGAIAFDTGFTAAFGQAPASPSLPTMAALKPIAERCLAQAEPNLKLCYSAGFAFGARSARGETIRIQ